MRSIPSWQTSLRPCWKISRHKMAMGEACQEKATSPIDIIPDAESLCMPASFTSSHIHNPYVPTFMIMLWRLHDSAKFLICNITSLVCRLKSHKRAPRTSMSPPVSSRRQSMELLRPKLALLLVLVSSALSVRYLPYAGDFREIRTFVKILGALRKF